MHDTLSSAGKLANNLPGLLLEAEKVAHTFMRGTHGRRRVGQGETFWQFRSWAEGDSRRDIDWKQTAKRDDVFIRQLEWEASQALWLWRDASASMDFTSSKKIPTKKNCAEILLLALAMLALDGGEQVNLIGTGLAPQSHHNAIRRVAEFLPRQTRLAETRVAARSQAVLFSDFYFDTAELSAFCSSLSQRGTAGLLVQLTDPAEKTLPYTGRVKFHDIEDDASVLTLPQVESVRALYEEKFIAHRQALADIARANGWKFLDFSTDVPRETILARLYEELAVKR